MRRSAWLTFVVVGAGPTGVEMAGQIAELSRYRDLGSLAAVSRYYAIGERRRARVWGFRGWLFWLVVHLAFLTGFKNRVSALFHWTISFFGRSRPERTITAQQIFARQGTHRIRPKRLAPPRACDLQSRDSPNA